MARARNSGESSKSRMKALACLSTAAGTVSAVRSSPKRNIGRGAVGRGLGGGTRTHPPQPPPLRGVPLGPVDRHEPARLAVEHVDQALRVVVGQAGNDAQALLLDRLGELAHAAAGGGLLVEVLVDDRDRKPLQEVHQNLNCAENWTRWSVAVWPPFCSFLP